MIDIDYCPICAHKLMYSTVPMGGKVCGNDLDLCGKFSITKDVFSNNFCFYFHHLRPYIYYVKSNDGNPIIEISKWNKYWEEIGSFSTSPSSTIEHIFEKLDFINSIHDDLPNNLLFL